VDTAVVVESVDNPNSRIIAPFPQLLGFRQTAGELHSLHNTATIFSLLKTLKSKTKTPKNRGRAVK